MSATIKVTLVHHNQSVYEVESVEKAREYTKRIVTEGHWRVNKDGSETFFPVKEVYKVDVIPGD